VLAVIDASAPDVGAARRGEHRIYLGYAPGVGKTHAMLEEALARLQARQDVVVGVLEPHSRPDTARLASGIERVPPMLVDYRGSKFEELDTDAVLARRPGWVIVDELAHTAVPGTPHVERWQAVEQMLEAGIGVLSTVNVQHIESLGDLVAQVTGTTVSATVPDHLIQDADDVVFVDIPPEELIERLRRGEVYAGDDTARALTHFFTRPTLATLRDQAQRLVAARTASRT
jgi:two-component system sensor histidine kinase KdpD